MKWCWCWSCAPVNIRCVGRPLGAILLMQCQGRSCLPVGLVCLAGVRVRALKTVKGPLDFLCSLRICSWDSGHVTSHPALLPHLSHISQGDELAARCHKKWTQGHVGRIRAWADNNAMWHVTVPSVKIWEWFCLLERGDLRMPLLLLPSCLSQQPSIS